MHNLHAHPAMLGRHGPEFKTNVGRVWAKHICLAGRRLVACLERFIQTSRGIFLDSNSFGGFRFETVGGSPIWRPPSAQCFATQGPLRSGGPSLNFQYPVFAGFPPYFGGVNMQGSNFKSQVIPVNSRVYN